MKPQKGTKSKNWILVSGYWLLETGNLKLVEDPVFKWGYPLD